MRPDYGAAVIAIDQLMLAERAYRSDNALDIRDFRGREDMDPVRLGRELGTGPGGWPVDWRNHDDSPF